MCNEFLPLCLVVDNLFIFILNFLVCHIRLYVVPYQQLLMTHALFTSPQLITVVAETDLTVQGSLVLLFQNYYQQNAVYFDLRLIVLYRCLQFYLFLFEITRQLRYLLFRVNILFFWVKLSMKEYHLSFLRSGFI